MKCSFTHTLFLNDLKNQSLLKQFPRHLVYVFDAAALAKEYCQKAKSALDGLGMSGQAHFVGVHGDDGTDLLVFVEKGDAADAVVAQIEEAIKMAGHPIPPTKHGFGDGLPAEILALATQ